MLIADYIGPCNGFDFEELKIATLYFDSINIEDNGWLTFKKVGSDDEADIMVANKDDPNAEKIPVVIEENVSYVTEPFREQIQVLIDENVVTIYDPRKSKIKKGIKPTEEEFTESLNASTEKYYSIDGVKLEFLQSEFHKIFMDLDPFLDKDAQFEYGEAMVKAEVISIIEFYKGKIDENSLQLPFAINYYSRRLSSVLSNISNGVPCITPSTVINDFFRFYKETVGFNESLKIQKTNNLEPNLAFEAIKLAVPNVSAFPFDEILETRVKANDELLEFRNELEILQFDLLENSNLDEIRIKSREIAKYKIEPKLTDLKRKIRNLKLNLPKIVLDQFKDPKSYTPLLGTVFGGIPTHIATLVSLGLISTSVIYDYLLKNNEIKNDGLYYLIKLENKFR